MENRFDGLTGKVEGLDAALSALEASKPDLEALRDYLESGQWQADYESDEAGRIPAGVKRGVLSQTDCMTCSNGWTNWSPGCRNSCHNPFQIIVGTKGVCGSRHSSRSAVRRRM